MKSSQSPNQLTPSNQEAFDTLIAAAETVLDETPPLAPSTGRDAKGRFTKKVVNTIATNEPGGQECAEGKRHTVSPEEGAPSTYGQREPAETVADPSADGECEAAETLVSPSTNGMCKPAETLVSPSTNGDFRRARSLSLWLEKIAAAARLASERAWNGQRLGA